MKKTYRLKKKMPIVAAALMLTAAVTSCIKDDDLEIFKNPFRVQGEIDPYYGFPIAYGELNFNDIISRLSSDYTGYLDTTTNLLTVRYHAETEGSIVPLSLQGVYATPRSASRPSPALLGSKDADPVWYSIDTMFRDTIDIDIFDNADIQKIVEYRDSISISHLWLNLSAAVKGRYASESIKDMFNEYVNATFDSLTVKYVDYDGNTQDFLDFSSNPIVISDITTGAQKHFDSIDVAPIINAFPKRLITTFRMRLKASSEIVSSNIQNVHFVEALDSLRMTHFDYSGALDVAVPFNLRVNHLHFSYDLDVDGSRANLDSLISSISEDLEADINDARIIFACTNGIPLEFMLNATFLAEDESPLFDIKLDKEPGDTAINAPNIVPTEPGSEVCMVESPVLSRLIATISNDEVNMLKQARKIRVSFRFGTAQQRHVVLSRNDFLRLKLYLQIHPKVSFDHGFELPSFGK